MFPLETSRAESRSNTGQKIEQIKSSRNSNFALIKSQRSHAGSHSQELFSLREVEGLRMEPDSHKSARREDGTTLNLADYLP